VGSLKEEIMHLQTLQSVDLRIVELNRAAKESSEEVVKRQTDIEERKIAIDEMQTRLAAIEQRRRELEAQIEDELARIKDRQAKLMNVQTNREYQSLLRETEDAKKANKQREEEVMRIMEEVETLKTRMAEEKNLYEAKEKLLAEDQQEADQKASDVRSQIEAIEKERAQKAASISVALLKKYDQLREKRNGLAVVGVKNGVCFGCHMNIPPQMFNDLMRNDRLLFCPSCHRIIYHASEGQGA
jgi:predicted  nucleic acid-binding Zn-ribbon protein